MNQNKHFHFIVPVWGKEYTKMFVDVCLPMLILLKGNLQDIPKNDKDLFVIVTQWHNAATIKSSEIYKKLQQIITVKFHLIDTLIDISSPHLAMSQCYAMAMKDKAVIPSETYYVFLTPDSFWSEGTFSHLYQLREQNFKVVTTTGIRTKAESMTKAILDLLKYNTSETLNLPLNALLKLIIEHIHPMTDSLDLLSGNNKFLNQWPSTLFWIDRINYQIIAHCYHLHPLMVAAPETSTNIGTTIDGDFITNLNYPIESFHVIQNDYIGVELTSSSRNWGQELSAPIFDKIKIFSYLHANDLHFYFFQHRIILGNPFLSTELIILVDKVTTDLINARKRKLIVMISKYKYYIKLKLNFAFLLFSNPKIFFKKLVNKFYERFSLKRKYI